MKAGVVFGKKKYNPDVGPMYHKKGKCPFDISPRRYDCDKDMFIKRRKRMVQ